MGTKELKKVVDDYRSQRRWWASTPTWVAWGDDKEQDKVLKTLVGCTLVSADAYEFVTDDGWKILFHYEPDCCATADVKDVSGDFADLVGSPLTLAEVVVKSQEEPEPEYPESWTWTFYKFATMKGYVDVQWLGDSNGYYSENVSVTVVAPEG